MTSRPSPQRVASRYLQGASVSLLKGSHYDGTGPDKGWVLYFVDLKPTSKGFSGRGILRWNFGKPGDEWAAFDVNVLRNTRRKVWVPLDLKWTSVTTGKNTWPRNESEMELHTRVSRIFQHPESQAAFSALVHDVFPPSVRGEYQGDLAVIPKSGAPRSGWARTRCGSSEGTSSRAAQERASMPSCLLSAPPKPLRPPRRRRSRRTSLPTTGRTGMWSPS